MKRYFYILCFVILGIILQQIAHTVLEVGIIQLLIMDFDKYGLGLSWDTWFMIHGGGGALLLIAGIVWGYLMGKKCWVWVYVEHRHWRKRSRH